MGITSKDACKTVELLKLTKFYLASIYGIESIVVVKEPCFTTKCLDGCWCVDALDVPPRLKSINDTLELGIVIKDHGAVLFEQAGQLVFDVSETIVFDII